MPSRRAVLALPAAFLACRASRQHTVQLGSGSFDTVTQLPVITARESGYFRDENISVNIDQITSAPRAMQALLGGSVDVISVPFEQVVLLAAEVLVIAR
jgi:ABC-type nitrate/sulfonate/bicarbonate transport system substrate-binding protein